jgi:hypothetical protein
MKALKKDYSMSDESCRNDVLKRYGDLRRIWSEDPKQLDALIAANPTVARSIKSVQERVKNQQSAKSKEHHNWNSTHLHHHLHHAQPRLHLDHSRHPFGTRT